MQSTGDAKPSPRNRTGRVIAVALVAPVALIFTVAIGLAVAQRQFDDVIPFALAAVGYWAFAGACWHLDA